MSLIEVALLIIGQIIGAAAIWGGIRADIRNMHDEIRHVRGRAEAAHSRIDSVMNIKYMERE